MSLKGALYWDRPPLRNVVTASCGRPSDDDGYPDGDLLRRRRRRLLQFAFVRSVRSLSSGADCRRRGGRTNELSECKRRREGKKGGVHVRPASGERRCRKSSQREKEPFLVDDLKRGTNTEPQSSLPGGQKAVLECE